MKSSSVLALATALGALCGLRSTAPLAVLSHAAKRNLVNLRGTPLDHLRSQKAVRILSTAAIGEMVVDKLAFAPKRTIAGSLIARTVNGGLCGAAVAIAEREAFWKGMLLGAGAAAAATFAGYHLRQLADRKLPDAASAVIEDALVVGSGAAIIKTLAA